MGYSSLVDGRSIWGRILGLLWSCVLRLIPLSTLRNHRCGAFPGGARQQAAGGLESDAGTGCSKREEWMRTTFSRMTGSIAEFLKCGAS
jgi:hypothetical protein